jgi:hypothetical protein
MLEETTASWSKLVEHVKQYIHNRLEYVQLSIAEKISFIISNYIALLLCVLLTLVSLTLFGMALAFLFAELTGKYYWGFLIVTIIYLLGVVSLWKMRKKWIQMPVLNYLLVEILNKKENEKDS